MWNETALLRLKRLAEMSDLEFYEKYLEDASFEDLAEFCKEFPEFLEEDAKAAAREYANMDFEKMLTEVKQKIVNANNE